MKNPFKKSSIVDTLVNVGVGGAANVAMDYLFNQVDALSSLGGQTKNLIKIGAGVLGGTMVKNKYLRPALDGIATVGAANLVASYLPDAKTTNGLAEGTIGRIGRMRMGQRGFARRASKVAGVGGADFMGC